MNSLQGFFDMIPSSSEEYIKQLKEIYHIESIRAFEGAVIFGTAQLGRKFNKAFMRVGVRISFFSDNDSSSWGTDIEGVKVIPPTQIDNHQIVIVASKFIKEIYAQLEILGHARIVPHYVLSILFPGEFPSDVHQTIFPLLENDQETIRKVYELLCDNESRDLFLKILKFRVSLLPIDLPNDVQEQYYPGNLWELNEQETYIDVGAFDGDTLTQFLGYTNNFSRYIALEPDSLSYAKLLKKIPQAYSDKITAICAGTGERAGTASFYSNGLEDARVVDGGPNVIRVLALDDEFILEPVTTIKMDVEGYEPFVLAGAKNIITLKKPKLAVCVYHKPWHLWELPSLIASYRNDYHFYLRHHEQELFGTVLYAV